MNNNKGGSFKPKKVYFSQVSNHALRDSNLSLKAKGLYALIQSYITIENFILYKNTLKKACLEGDTSFESGWKELKDKGYLIQEKHQNSDGTFYYLYDLLDIPNHTPKTEGMDNLGNGNGGIYSYTNSINTDLNNTEKYKVYKGDTTTSRDKAFSFDILNKQIDKIFKENYENEYIGNLTIGDVKELFVIFYEIGNYRRGIKPTRLKNEQVENIIESLYCIGDDEFEPTLEDYKLIIEDYFKQDFPNCDYGINHFASGDVILMRCYSLRDYF